ncbi:hypothetical protein SCP_0605690 [Sparassis crispa]|uniref:DUF6534 domain-containing protein n=1 Tax=Sparassis crispa TaxID=139825 RepID=A0A401GR01_9APHY|nr:hypothetical protein SCP_0605690 [Sparassis crispa]GBE84590.1 hypothetical protein SCP_0605690 [Sparassis crispa]
MVIATNSTITALIVPASGMATIIEELLEGLLVEVFVAIFLYGIATAQVYFYWMNFANDSVWIRSTVLLVWVLETVHTCMCVKMITQYTIVDFGDVPAVAHIIWSAGVTVMLAVLIAAMVQTFFIHRIWILSRRSKLITAIPAVLLFVRVAFGLATASLLYRLPTWSEFRSNVGPLFTLTCGISLAAFVDLIIAVGSIYYLWHSRTGFERTDHIIRSLITYLVSTGALTVAVSFSIVLTFVFLKNSLLFAGLVEVQSKLYANSFMATLNARKLRSRGEHSAQEYNSNSIELGPSRRQGTQTDHKTMKPIEIFQHTTNISDNTGGVVDERNSVAQLKVVRSSIELGETYQKPQSLV